MNEFSPKEQLAFFSHLTIDDDCHDDDDVDGDDDGNDSDYHDDG